jgi:SAM-dependent methyltransferase
MYKRLKEKGREASDYYAGCKEYFSLTPASQSLLDGLHPIVVENCRGRLLDAGAGRGAYRDLLSGLVDEYVGVDIAASSSTAVVADAQRLPFADVSFDTVFCSQVLEHVPEPWLAIQEFRRVLKPEGKLILTVPHLSWLHNEPHDYLRFTSHGLRFLTQKASLDTHELLPAGGIFSFLGHVPSTIVMNITFGIPLLHYLVRWLNRCWVSMVCLLDRHFEKKKIFALNFIIVCSVADKPSGTDVGS